MQNKTKAIALVVGGVALIMALCVVLALIGLTADPPEANEGVAGPNTAPTSLASSGSAAPSTTPAASAAPATFGDGDWLVPSQMAAGQYRTTVPADSLICSWKRLRGTSGSPSDIIAYGVADANEQKFVTIAATDKAFSTDGCGKWTRTG